MDQRVFALPNAHGVPGRGNGSAGWRLGAIGMLGLALGGCGDGRGHTHTGAGDLVPLLIPFEYLGLAITADAMSAHPHRRFHSAGERGEADSRPDIDVYVSAPNPPPLRSALDATPARLGAISGPAVLEAIDARDFHRCRVEGTPPGWNHALVTFKPNGAVSRVVIDWSVWMSRSANACFRAELGRIAVPAFQGGETKLGVWFFTF